MRAFFVFIIISFFVLSSTAQDVPRTTVIQDVRLFDGEAVVPRCTVVVCDGKIEAVGQKVSIPDGAEVVPGEGKILIPGLIDAHVHVVSEEALKQSLIFGVTTVVDMFMSTELMKNIKKKQSSGEAEDMASLISAGTLVTAPGGHGTQFISSMPTITKPEEAQDFVDARIAEGSDFIKIIYDNGSAYSVEIPTLDGVTLTAVIEAAHERNKLAVVHIMTLKEAQEAIEAGADGLAHLFCNDAFDEDFGRYVSQHGAFVIPTLTVLENVSGVSGASSLVEDPRLSHYLKQTDITALKQPFPVHSEQGGYKAAQRTIRQLRAEHVPLLAGTDAPNPGTTYGASLHRELELLVQAGLSPVEALKAATSAPAEIFGLGDRGRIKSGMKADLVLVNGDPITDIEATRDIVTVWKNGVKADREMYRSSIEKERLAADRLKSAPPPPGSESGLVSDFEAEEITTNFGAGWSVSTDAVMGGKSTAEFRRVNGGAQGSRGSMLIEGSLARGNPYQWAGAYFSPGKTLMAPANLSSKKSISFWASGDGKTYSVMFFCQSQGFTPAVQTFVSHADWSQYTFPFEKFNTDGHDIIGIFIGSASEVGDFELKIDNIRLRKNEDGQD